MSFNTEFTEREFDAVVIGSGAAGSTVAAKLAAAGRSVLIVEAGPSRSSNHMVSSQLWARRLKWTGSPVIESGKNPVGHVFNSGSGTGGAAAHHYAVWPRFHAEDFAMASRYGIGLDWPIEYEDLRPYYDLVQKEAGIAGDADAETWRPDSDPYPMPPVTLFEQGRRLAVGFEKLGKSVAPLPLAVTTREYNGRPPCIWDGWCDAGCPIGALANPLTVYLPLAKSNGAVLSTDTPVTRIVTSEDGRRATGVVVKPDPSTEFVIRARLVVLAAFAIQNPRLLLASRSAAHPDGLGNNHAMVGKYIMSHSAALVYGLFDDETRPYEGAFGGQLVNQDSYAKDTHAADGAFGSYQWMIAQAVRPNDLLGIATTRVDLFGDDLHQFMKRAVRGFASMTGVVEGLPDAGNAVSLADETDELGVPLARVSHTHDERTNALWNSALAEGRKVFEAAGASEVWTGPQGAMHIMGGTIMGNDPEASVTDSYGRLHDADNIFVAGPGLFPTSAGVNPTFTLTALAARTAAYINDNWHATVRG